MRAACGVVLLLCAAVLPALAGEAGSAAGESGGAADGRFAEAEAALKEAQTATANAAEAAERIARLKDVLERFPDYPDSPMLQYFLGVNCQILERYGEAVDAFEAALRGRPELRVRTPIESYLQTARRRRLATRLSWALIGVLVAVMALAFWRLARADAAEVHWGRLLAPFAAALVLWAALGLLLPLLMGPPTKGIDGFPKPVLANFRLGQTGDAPLRALMWYGAFAILVAAPVIAATSRISRPLLRRLLAVAGVLLATGSVSGLYYLRYCSGRSSFGAGTGRLLFHVKDIATKEEVPDEMLPLYDPDFRKKILESRKKGGK